MNSIPSILQPAVRKGPRYSVRPFYTSLVVFTGLVLLSWALRSGTTQEFPQRTSANVFLARRETEPDCRLVREVEDQCAYVRTNCPDHQDGLFSYLQLYYCALPDAKPVAFTILILWLSLLFSTIGIAASDFLCIDLSTLASILGLSESLTGVTFLAFGNGSPDVFSTFAAMRSNSGSLAIGELIGAASFITSVVAGSMALVRPFKVARRSFVRDVGYFVIAVSFSMFLLADGRLYMWESVAMVALYVFYVVMVVTWHWYLVRRRRRYERDLAARAHFHIPDNQELDIEEQVEDDDPGVASESRSLLRGASTDDFDMLERAEGVPTWKQEEDEDDETRNRYLAEISENMHVYRPPNRSRRNTMNPIRPSLVGALEFQSVLHSLQKSRNTNNNPTIYYGGYSDDGDNSQPFDTRSIASHPRASRPSAAADRLSPQSATGSARVRAVSANDADGLQLDTSLLRRQQDETPLLTVRRPSNEAGGQPLLQPPELPRIDVNAALTASPSSSGLSSLDASPVEVEAPHTPDLLAPPDTFQSPNYQTSAKHDRSPVSVSPRGTASSSRHRIPESPSAPFPAFIDISPSPSSRPPSIRLPNPATSPSEQLLVHDHPSSDDLTFRDFFKRWWPYSVLPPPQQIGCTLFPTLAGWKSKSIMERFLGIVAAPSVFLLTITVPVIEPQAAESEELDPIPTVIIDEVNGDENDNPGPRIRLPADSPILSPIAHDLHDSIPQLSVSHPHRKSTIQDPTSRPRWDSELPAVPSAAPVSMPVRDWNRWLVITQLFTGPFFFVLIAWTTIDEELDPRNLLFPSLISLLCSFVFLSFLLITTKRRPWHRRHTTDESMYFDQALESPSVSLPSSWRPFLSLLGFLVAISWIATIATEVVSLLKTLGVILDISDSLLGLTVFAVGNSLGDLVADITVARLGYPVMALSACFGGPMLNILLGIGLGGMYMTVNGGQPRRRDEIMGLGTISTEQKPYKIEISKVLVISGATLLVVLVGLLIVVPLNNWRMDRKIGWGLVAVWCISTLGNVITEVAF